MAFSRRRFLRDMVGSGLALAINPISAFSKAAGAAAAGGPAATGGRTASRMLPATGQPLRIPPVFSGDTIVASVQHQRVWPDLLTEVWTLGGTYPAPTIRVRKGDALAVKLVNQLGEPTNIHWHGLTIPANMDGYPSDVAQPGGSIDYAFTIEQRAGTYWYHPHPDMRTGPQVYKGMAGLLIVEDDEELALGLPSGEFDVPLVLQDRRIDPSGAFDYTLTDDDHLEGYLGDAILANGTSDAYLEVATALYRFRVLNGSNSRVLDLALADGSAMLVIGTDGGLLDRPYEAAYIYLGPAERVEILIDFSRYKVGDSIVMKSLAFSGNTGRKQGSEMQVIRFDVTRAATSPVTVPTALTSYEHLDATQAVGSRTFITRIDHSTTPATHTINDKMFDMERIDEQVRAGDLERWTFNNVSFQYHPMHVHGAQFQVLTRNGSTNFPARDFGWKDTVLVGPYEKVDVAIRFALWPGKFLLHCHNLEHEDHGMMLNYEVTGGNAGVAGEGSSMPEHMDLR